MKNPTDPITLIANGRSLCTPNSAIESKDLREWYDDGEDPILIFEYPSGDVDTIAWPKPNRKNLAGALYDARETGLIPDVPTVILPDGTEFNIDTEL